MNKKFSFQSLLSIAVVTGTAIASEPTTQTVNQTTTPSSDVSEVASIAAALSVTTTTQPVEVPAQTVTVPSHAETVLIPEQKPQVTPADTVKLTTDIIVVPGPGDIALDGLEKISKSVNNLINPAKEMLGSVAGKVGSELNKVAGKVGSELNKVVDLEASNTVVQTPVEKVADLEASNTVVQTPVETEVKDSEFSISEVVDSSTTDANLSSVVNDQAACAKNNEEAKTKTWTEYGNAVVTHVKGYKWCYGTVGVAVLGYAGYKAYEAYQAKREADRERVLEKLSNFTY